MNASTGVSLDSKIVRKVSVIGPFSFFEIF